jgi:hypothetical protein
LVNERHFLTNQKAAFAMNFTILQLYPEQPQKSIPIYTGYKYLFVNFQNVYDLRNLRRYEKWIHSCHHGHRYVERLNTLPITHITYQIKAGSIPDVYIYSTGR